MSTIIKAADRSLAIQSIAFNFDDVRTNAEQYLVKIREQAVQIIAEAKREADAIRARAEIDGRRTGEAAVEQKLDQRMHAAMVTLTPALQNAANEVRQSKGAWLAHWERQAIRLSVAIAERILRRELARDPKLPLPLIREALELASGQGRVRVLLNPIDHAALAAQVELLSRELSRLGPAEIVSDGAVSPGGCRVETQHGAIDQQLNVQLNRIEEELND